MSQQNVEIIRRGYEDLNRRDIEAWLAAFHPDAEMYDLAGHPDVPARRGHDALREWVEMMDETWEDGRHEPLRFVDAGAFVLVALRARGRRRGVGVPVDIPLFHVFEMRYGKVVRGRACLDEEDALEAVGLSDKAMSQENAEVVRRLVDAFNRDDTDTVLSTFDEGCEIDEPPQMPDSPATGYRGHDGVREWMGNLRGVGGISFELRVVALEGETLICDMASRGLGRGIEWMTIAAFDVRHGKIIRIRVFLDRAAAVEAAGLSE